MLCPDLLLLQDLLSQSGLLSRAVSLSDSLLTQKFNAARAQAQRELRVFFEPTEILPNDAPQTEVDALIDADTPYYQESGYDYDPQMFSTDTFGFMVLRQKPIIAIHSIELNYPTPENKVFTIPNDWIRIDKKYGQLNIIPTALSAAVPISSYLLNVMSGNRSIPMVMKIRYRAGLTDIENQYPDIIELINRMTVLNVLKGAFIPGQGSLSVDGITRSTTITMADWQRSIDELMNSLRDSIHGVRMVVM